MQQMRVRIWPDRGGGKTPGRFVTDSHRHPGHENRMASHAFRIHNHPCQCGSGKRYADCCISRPDQERRELARRKKEARKP